MKLNGHPHHMTVTEEDIDLLLSVTYNRSGKHCIATIKGCKEDRYFRFSSKGWEEVSSQDTTIERMIYSRKLGVEPIHRQYYEVGSIKDELVMLNHRKTGVLIARSRLTRIIEMIIHTDTPNLLVIQMRARNDTVGESVNRIYTVSFEKGRVTLDIDVEEVHEEWWGMKDNPYSIAVAHPWNEYMHHMLPEPHYRGENLWICSDNNIFIKSEDKWVGMGIKLSYLLDNDITNLLPESALLEYDLYKST